MDWIIDGMNLIGSRPDGWWRDRPAARRRLVTELDRFASEAGEQVTVVFDGRPQTGEAAAVAGSGVSVVFAPGGPNAADERIAAMAAALLAPGGTTVVNSDADLRHRVERAGVAVMGVSRFTQVSAGRPRLRVALELPLPDPAPTGWRPAPR